MATSAVTIEPGEIASIRFGVYTEAEKRRLAAVEVTTSTINDQAGMPRDNGPNSLLMGTDSHRTFCKSCNNTVEHCQGHPGIIIFPERFPVYNPLYLLSNDITKTLNMLCMWCSTPLAMPLARVPRGSEKAFAAVLRQPLQRKCPACGHGPTTDPYCARCAERRERDAEAVRAAKKEVKRLAAALKRLQQQRARLETQRAGKRSGASARLRKNQAAIAAATAELADAKKACGADAADSERKEGGGKARSSSGRQSTRVTCPNPACGAACHPFFERKGFQIVPKWPADLLAEQAAEVQAAAQAPFTSYRCWQVLNYVPEPFRRDVLQLRVPLADIFIWRSIFVPPVFIRPSISVRGANSEEDITRCVADVSKRTIDLRARLAEAAEAGEPEPGATTAGTDAGTDADADADSVAKAWRGLQKAVNMLVDRDIAVSGSARPMKQAVGHNKPRRTLMGRMTGKHGRLRGGLMSKRVNCCARAVAGPSSTCDVDEIGIPERNAMRMPVVEVMSNLNRDDLLTCVRKGAHQIGGALSVQHQDGTTTNLTSVNPEDTELIVQKCRVGDKVVRMLRAGDYVPLNRQPTLSQMSFMPHRVFLHQDATHKMNKSATAPYNADFDGDETNVHIPQGLEARAEMKHLTSVRCNAIDPSNMSPAFLPVQDAMSGLYVLSRADTRVPREVMFDMYMSCKTPRKSPEAAFGDLEALQAAASLCQDGELPGTRAIDILLPSSFSFSRGSVEIRSGVIQPGSAPISKKQLGGPGGLLHLLALHSGEAFIIDFVSDLGRLVRVFFRDHYGFTFGFRDILLEPDVVKAMKQGIAATVAEANQYDAEEAQIQVLSRANDIAEEALARSQVYRDSNLRVMVESGAKGKVHNVAQIMGCLGQQIVGSRRPQNDESGRALSCFRPGDAAVHCHGFTQSSFLDGLTPAENSFHARGAREGVTEVQTGTAKSGYMQRKITKLLENMRLVFDFHGLSVRDARNGVVLLYYLNGWGTRYCEPVRLDSLAPSFSPCARVRQLGPDDPVGAELAARRRELRRCRELLAGVNEPDFQFMLPLNVERWLTVVRRVQDTARAGTCPKLTAAVRKLQGRLDTLPLQFHVVSALRYHVLRTVVAHAPNLTPALLDDLWAELSRRVFKCAAEAGTAVGTQAAAATAKNITQSTLNTFHFAGSGSSANKTGIDFIKELVEVSMTGVAQVRVQCKHAAVNRSREALEKVARALLPVRLRDLVADVQVLDRGATWQAWQEAREACGGFADVFLPALDFAGFEPASSSSDEEGDSDEEENEEEENEEEENEEEENEEEAGYRCVMFDLDRAKLAAHQLTSPDAARELAARTALPFHFTPFHSANPGSARLTVWFPANSFSLAACQAHSVTLLELLLAGHEQILYAGVFAAPNRAQEAEPMFEIRATTKALHKKRPATGLLPFFEHEEFFDVENMYCSSLAMTHAVYGIEAALLVLFRELYATVCNSGFVHPHHIFLLCVTICITGRPLAVTRHGMKAKGCDVFQQASFEQPRAVFTTAALHGQSSTDVKRCLSSSTIVGGVAGVGTGTVTIKTDPAYQEVWDQAQAAAAQAARDQQRTDAAQAVADDAGAVADRRKAMSALSHVPHAVRPTQLWCVRQDPQKLLQAFRDHAVAWLSIRPALRDVKGDADVGRRGRPPRPVLCRAEQERQQCSQLQTKRVRKFKKRCNQRDRGNGSMRPGVSQRPARDRDRKRKREVVSLFRDDIVLDKLGFMDDEFEIGDMGAL
jgi:DNA-directed RNA polymerase beta' subunit